MTAPSRQAAIPRRSRFSSRFTRTPGPRSNEHWSGSAGSFSNTPSARRIAPRTSGRFPEIDRATALWDAGNRREALALVPDEAVLHLCAIGSAETVADRLEQARRAGATLPFVQPQSLDAGDASAPTATCGLWQSSSASVQPEPRRPPRPKSPTNRLVVMLGAPIELKAGDGRAWS